MSGVGSVCIKLELALEPGYFCACNKCDKRELKPLRKERSDKGKTKKVKEDERAT
jgi:hypothetical protein